jgi:signal transduction histidine kinase/ActR/RegA family two-component response regulator
MHGVHVFVRNHRDDIVRAWETLVLGESRVVNLTGVALRNSIPQLLDELTDWLESGEPAAGAKVGAQSLKHVVQRLDEGLDLAQVLREYRLLRESIFRVVLEAEAAEQERAGALGERARAARVVELARLNAGLDVALSDSVAEFVAERDRRIAVERNRAAVLSEALGVIDLAIHSSHDLGRVVQTALQQATNVLGTETAALSLREGAAWVVRYVHGLAPDVIGARMVDDDEPHAVLALREQQPVAIPDAWNDPRVNHDHMRRWNIRAVMVVPLILRGETTGVVFFNDHRGPRALGPTEINFGAKFGAALSLAIENAHLFDELREADRRKTEFLAVLSHELRNPLAAIRNSIALLDRAPADGAAARRAKDILRRQSDHLVRLVDDLLDLSRITHGKMVVELVPMDARELVRRAYLDAKVLFDVRGVELMLSDDVEPLWIEADPARFSQMLGNLLQNALKFTAPRGLVKLEVGRQGAACEVSVKDDGQGLDPADFDRIFDPFEQAGGSREGAAGLGLGLALVKRLAAKHKGTVRVHSDGVGYGAEFVLELPVIAAPAPAREFPSGLEKRRSTPMTILVVDDNEDAAATLADLLTLRGHCVSTANTGKAAVNVMFAQRPNVVICDVGLPDMSGYEVIRAIRGRENGNRVFAVALTGYAQLQDRDAALAAGFDAHLAKPTPLDELDAVLRGIAEKGYRTGR